MLIVQLVLLLVIRIEVVEKQVIVLNAIFQMIHYLLLFVDLDTKTASVIKNIIVVIDRMVHFASETTTSSNDQLPLRFKRVFSLSLSTPSSTTRPQFL